MHDFFQIFLKLVNMFFEFLKIVRSLELGSQSNFPDVKPHLSIPGFKLLHASRNANGAVHRVAREALLCNNVLDFFVTPGHLIDLIQSEKLLPNE